MYTYGTCSLACCIGNTFWHGLFAKVAQAPGAVCLAWLALKVTENTSQCTCGWMHICPLDTSVLRRKNKNLYPSRQTSHRKVSTCCRRQTVSTGGVPKQFWVPRLLKIPFVGELTPHLAATYHGCAYVGVLFFRLRTDVSRGQMCIQHTCTNNIGGFWQRLEAHSFSWVKFGWVNYATFGFKNDAK